MGGWTGGAGKGVKGTGTRDVDGGRWAGSGEGVEGGGERGKRGRGQYKLFGENYH